MRHAILAGETRVDVVSIVMKNISLVLRGIFVDGIIRMHLKRVCACVRTSSFSVLLSHLHVVLVLVEGAFWQSSVTDGDIGAHV